MRLSKICPSLAIGFYLRDQGQFETFKSSIERVRQMDSCFFSVFKQKQDSSQYTMENKLRVTQSNLSEPMKTSQERL